MPQRTLVFRFTTIDIILPTIGIIFRRIDINSRCRHYGILKGKFRRTILLHSLSTINVVLVRIALLVANAMKANILIASVEWL